MISYINELQRVFRDELGFKPTGGTESVPLFDNIPDGEYLCTIEGRLDLVKLINGKINCCNFEEAKKLNQRGQR